jgi:hypothetical protein
MYSLTPVMVPPVPTPEIRISTLPSVSSQISGPVVSKWILGLAGLSNCCGMNPSGVLARISCAFEIAPFIPFGPGVKTNSAPKARSRTRRSMLMVSGMTMISL